MIFPYGKSENCSNFRRHVQEAVPYESVWMSNAKL